MYTSEHSCKKHKLKKEKGKEVKIHTVFDRKSAEMELNPKNDLKIKASLDYIYSITEGGAIFGLAIAGKKPRFTALINLDFENTWHCDILLSNQGIKDYIRYKSLTLKKKVNATLKPKNKWTNNGCLINMYSYGGSLFNSYTYELVNMFEESLKDTKINSCFILWLKDFPILNKEINGIPILSQSTSPGFHDLPIPNNEEWQMITKKFFYSKCDFSDTSKVIPFDWNSKIEKGFFRGSGTGCYNDTRNPRIAVSYLSEKFPEFLDAGIVAYVQRDKLENNTISFMNPNDLHFKLKQKVPMYEFGRYKYILNIKGNGAAYRLPFLFFLGSVVLIVQSQFRLWFEDIITPYVHYIPVKEDLSDLIDVIKWCKNNDYACKKIAQNGLTFAKKWFTKEYIKEYLIQLLKSPEHVSK